MNDKVFAAARSEKIKGLMAIIGAKNVGRSGDSDPKSWSGNCCLQLAHAISARDVREGKRLSQVAAALKVAVVEDFPQNFF